MTPVSFVLAVPRGAQEPRTANPINIVHSLDQICSRQPQLWMSAATTAIDLGPAGRIVGVVFARGSPVRLGALAPDAPTAAGPVVLANWLTRYCWGAYFAVLCDAASGTVHIYPDPSGLLPVYRRETETHVLMASRPDLLGEVTGGEAVRVSWSHLHSYIAWPDLRQHPTCLAEISELTPGALTTPGAARETPAQIWRPEQFLPTRRPLSFDTAAEALRDLATMTIGGWAAQLGPVAVAASGGVDSSLICAALARGGHAPDCITLATTDPSGDESAFVRQLGEHFGVRTIAATYALAGIDLLRPASAGLARPSRKSFMIALDRALSAAADQLNAAVVFDGNGGDNLFCYLHSAAPVIDRLHTRGQGNGVASTFIDICRVTGCDVPTMARAALQRLVRPPPPGLWPPDLRLMAGQPQAAPGPLTRWLDIDVGHRRGKRDHVALIMRGQTHVHDIGSLPRFSPLMSQPLIEYCLGIPTWLWCEGGINRALARVAFAPDLPREIVVRTSKAGPDSFIRKLFDAQRPTIREALLDGLLASQNILDRKATEAALFADPQSGDTIVYRLLDLIEAESWARSWHR